MKFTAACSVTCFGLKFTSILWNSLVARHTLYSVRSCYIGYSILAWIPVTYCSVANHDPYSPPKQETTLTPVSHHRTRRHHTAHITYQQCAGSYPPFTFATIALRISGSIQAWSGTIATHRVEICAIPVSRCQRGIAVTVPRTRFATRMSGSANGTREVLGVRSEAPTDKAGECWLHAAGKQANDVCHWRWPCIGIAPNFRQENCTRV
jgi:hypothetical protein